jgi:hypothetical protein
MITIFPSQVGRPAVVKDPKARVASFHFWMSGWNWFTGSNCIIQGVTAQTKGNYQFLHTIGNYTYVYVFGELMGDMQVTGLALCGKCPNSNLNGIYSAVAYYNTHAISVTGRPVFIDFCGLPLAGFIVGAAFGHTDPKSRIGQFTFNIKIISS